MIAPFARGKFEHSAKHLYFLPPTIISQLESAQPIILIGSRGSGKTTLLRALDYQERTSNASLQSQLTLPFRGKFIGVYAKLSLHPCRSLEPLFGKNTAIEGRLLGLYVDALFVNLIATAISDMISNGIVIQGPKCREASVARIYNEKCGALAEWSGHGHSETIKDVAESSLMLMHKLERLAQRGKPINSIVEEIRVPGFGEYSRPLARAMQELCDDATIGIPGSQDDSRSTENVSWHFKVCLDEAESLSDEQKIVLNTLLRQAESPLFPVISFVSRPVDLTTTLIPGLTIQKADVRQIPLDNASNLEFMQLAEGVATVRCRDVLDERDIQFSCDTVFGKLSLDTLVDRIVKVSENPEATSLRQLAEGYEKLRPGTGSSRSNGPLPFVEAFLAEELRLGLPGDSPKAVRKQQSEEFRKKMVVAYLAICRRLSKANVPFAYSSMVVGVSDNCIRDFLSQVQSVFDCCYPTPSEQDLQQFLSQEVGIDKQEIGLRRSSEEKRDSIPRSGVLHPVEIGMLVRGLAYITSDLQSQGAVNGGELSERGIFYLEGGSNQARLDATQLVRDAAEAGFLRIVIDESSDEPLSGFRVHSSLAPAFNFSYRGAYYRAVLRPGDFERIIECRDEPTLRRVCAAIANRIVTKAEAHPTLFSAEDFEE